MPELLRFDLATPDIPQALDFATPSCLLEILSERTGIPTSKIHRLTLESLTPFLWDGVTADQNDFETYTRQYAILLPANRPQYPAPDGWMPWLPYQPDKYAYACRDCVVDDPTPIMRLARVLPLMLSCPIHERMLEPCILSGGYRVFWRETEIPAIPHTPAIHAMDNRTWQAFHQGFTVVHGRTIHAGSWFRILRTVLEELNTPLKDMPRFKRQMARIWKIAGYNTRTGSKQWEPYERLPEGKRRMLMAVAAIALQMLEDGEIQPKGRDGFLFQKARCDAKDLPPGENGSSNVKTIPLCPDSHAWQDLNHYFEHLLGLAKKDPAIATQLRSVLLLGRKDASSIAEIEAFLAEGGASQFEAVSKPVIK